jgi:omega-amidase
MNIALIQSSLVWENPEENRNYFQKEIDLITAQVDLIVLPEMFTSGFTMQPKNVAESMTGETITWLQSIAKVKNSAITGSLIIQEDGHYYNRMVFVFPSGAIEKYDKRHLFTLAGEEKIFTHGNEKVIVEYKHYKICLQVCYDLRFPVFARNVEQYDVLIYVASWPKTRINAWDILLKARAIENMCYVIGVNRLGVDGNNMEYIGHSQVNDFLGNSILSPQKGHGVFMAQLDHEKMTEIRMKLPFLNDRDVFKIS